MLDGIDQRLFERQLDGKEVGLTVTVLFTGRENISLELPGAFEGTAKLYTFPRDTLAGILRELELATISLHSVAITETKANRHTPEISIHPCPHPIVTMRAFQGHHETAAVPKLP
jgi:hypothetical protein